MPAAAHLAAPIGVQVVLERKDGHVLLLLRHNTGFFDQLYSLPGGHLEANETFARTAARELREELALTLAPAAFRHLGVCHRLSDTHRIDAFLHARLPAHAAPVNAEPHKHAALRWVAPHQLPDNTVPYVREALARHWQNPQSGGWFFETGFPSF